MIALLLGAALAGEHHVVMPGERLSDIAATLGDDPTLEQRLRTLNGLGPGEEPEVGAVLLMPPDPALPPVAAALRKVHREVEVTLPGEAPRAARESDLGMALPDGSRVCTGPDSFATLRLALDPVSGAHDDVSLMPDTCLTVDAVGGRPAGRSALVSLRRGSVAVLPVVAGEGGLLTVRTRDGVATATQGGHRVHIEEGATRTEAVFGEVDVIGAGSVRRLPAGTGNRVTAGSAPTEPVPLLPPGTPLAPARGAPLRLPDFDWTPVPGALGYRVEVGLDPELTELVMARDVGVVPWQPELLLLPYSSPGLWWRVTAFDRLGYLGIPAEGWGFTFPAGARP